MTAMHPTFGMKLPDSTGMTLRALGMTAPIGYTVRGLYRTTEVTDDRRLDYWWRDLYITDVMFFLQEVIFRMANKMLSFPQYQRFLELDHLKDIPGLVNRRGKGKMPEALRTRVATSLVQPRSLYLVPDTIESNLDLSQPAVNALREHLIPRLSPEQNIRETLMRAHGFQPGRITEMGEDEKLITSLIREMDQQERSYLDTLKNDLRLRSHPRKESILKILDEDSLAKTLLKALADKKATGGDTAGGSLRDMVMHQLHHAKPGDNVSQAHVLKDWLSDRTVYQHLEQLGESHLLDDIRALHHGDELMCAIKQGVHSKAVSAILEKVNKKSYWPQLIGTFIVGYMVQGTMMNAVDYKFLQPFEKKLYEKYGTTQSIIPASLWSLIPGAGVFMGLLQTKKPLPLTRKLGYISRFSVAGLAGLAVYGLSTAYLTMKGLEKLRPQQQSSGKLPLKQPPAKNPDEKGIRQIPGKMPETAAPLSMIRSFDEPDLFSPEKNKPVSLRRPSHFAVFQSSQSVISALG